MSAPTEPRQGLTYAQAGADAEIGGFGGLFDLKRAGFKNPVLVTVAGSERVAYSGRLDLG